MNALDHKFNALEGETESVVPDAWNPGHIAFRVIQGFEVLSSMTLRVGPAQYGTSWPMVLQEFSELTEEDARAEARNAFAQNYRQRWTGEDVKRAYEALEWPLRFLQDYPQRGDALLLWAFCKANKRSINKALRTRAQRAGQLAQAATAQENAHRARKRQELTRKVLDNANRAIAANPSAALDVKAAAVAYFADHSAALRDVVIRPGDVVPGRVLTRTTLDRHLQPALATLVLRLTNAGVPVT